MMNKSIITDFSSIGKYKNYKELKINLERFLKKNFDNSTKISNRHTGFIIGYNNNYFKKLTSGTPGELKCIALTSLKDIIKEGVLFNVKIDSKLREDIMLFYWFMCFVTIKNKKYVIRYSVKYTKTGKFIYSGHLDIKEKYPSE